jgi:hypothetical protein
MFIFSEINRLVRDYSLQVTVTSGWIWHLTIFVLPFAGDAQLLNSSGMPSQFYTLLA